MKSIIESDNEHTETFGTDIDWSKVNEHVRRLQDRLYRAADEGNFGKLKALQKLTINSYYVKLYAIKQITKENTGKTTPGIDGKTYLTDMDRSQLLNEICNISLRKYKPRPVKRAYIPKQDGRKRSLGIPTILDRVIQAMVKLAIEPELESKFHGNSFGFRPGRCCQDAIELIRDTIRNGNGNYILDADITKYFDNIQHKDILSKMHYFREIVGKWLKAGTIICGNLVKTGKGTPQGGVISPLLANIALNDLDHKFNGIVGECKATVVRYADDFVVLTKYRMEILKIQPMITEFLERKGLSLNAQKTKIVRKEEGFDFLGFNIVHHPGKTIWIQASRKGIKKFHRNIKEVFDCNKQAKTDILILKLNKKILGWARYYQYSKIFIVFPRLNKTIWIWTWKWCTRRHKNKGKRWIKDKYLSKEGDRKWTLCGDTFSLARVTDIKSSKYNWKVGNKSLLNPKERKLWEMDNRIQNTEEICYII